MPLRGRERALVQRIPRWPQRFRARGVQVVVNYHRIGRPERPDCSGMTVDPDLFRRQLEALRDSFHVVAASEIRRDHGRPTVAITFDDGYVDNYLVAAPILRELGLPATFFIVTDALHDEREFWWDRLEHLVLDDLPPSTVEVGVGARRFRAQLADADLRTRELPRLSRLLMALGPAEVEAALVELSVVAGGPPAPCARHRRMSSAQIVELGYDPLFEIGSHTCSHHALRALPGRDCAQELHTSRRLLADVIGRPPPLLAYPFGAPGTVGRRDARFARAAGHEMAFANVTGPVEGCDPFAVPRVPVGDWEPAEFVRQLARWTPR